MNVYDIIVDENVVESVAFINGCENSINEYIADYYTEYGVEATSKVVKWAIEFGHDES